MTIVHQDLSLDLEILPSVIEKIVLDRSNKVGYESPWCGCCARTAEPENSNLNFFCLGDNISII